MTALYDKEHTEIFAGGAAGGCPLEGTEISTDKGFVKIEDIKVGDFVLSLDESTSSLVHNKVLQKFIKGVRLSCVEVKLQNGNTIRITREHRFLQHGRWTALSELIKRELEDHKRLEWKVLDKQQRTIKNIELEEFWTNYDNETSKEHERIFANSYSLKRKKTLHTTPPSSGTVFYTKPSIKDSSEPHRLQHSKQRSGKSRVDYTAREFQSFKKSRSFKQLLGECRERIQFEIKKGFGQRNEFINREPSQRDKKGFQTRNQWSQTTRGKIWCSSRDYKRHYPSQELEARELNFDDIVEIRFFLSRVPAYDLEVENTANYIITRDKIIIHNSKSFTGCLWIATSCLKYSGSRWFLARARLKSLKESTLLTFWEVCKMLGLEKDKHYNYNDNMSVIKFFNGSEVYLKDLFLYPSDHDFVALGSTEFTGGFIDEMGEITEQAYNIMKSRVRFKLEEFGLIPKVFMGSNPCKTFIYKEFYRKWRDGALESHKCYIPASVYDNPFISPHYIENLKRLDPTNRARLLDGNWEYDDDDSKLFEYDKIIDMLNNSYVEGGTAYLSVDVARFGRDLAVIVLWHGFKIMKVYTYDKSSSKFLREKLESLCVQHHIARSNVVIDEDGVGGGLVDEFTGCKGFVNNSKMVEDTDEKEQDTKRYNYANLRSQCYFKLASMVNKGLIGCVSDLPANIQTSIVEELEQIKRKDIDKDGPLRVIGKDVIKENIGHSPDFCFTEGNSVLTNEGDKEISSVQEGDFVVTPFGTRLVERVGSRVVNDVLKLTLSDGRVIFTTEGHQFFANGTFKYAYRLVNDDKLSFSDLWSLTKWRIKKLSYITKRNIGFRKQASNTTTTQNTKHYITKYGKTTTKQQYKKETTYTILTEMLSTIKLKIYNYFYSANTEECTFSKDSKTPYTEKKTNRTFSKHKKQQRYGTPLLKGLNGIKPTTKTVWQKQQKTNTNAFIAKKNLNQQGKKEDFARTNVFKTIITQTKRILKVGVVFVAKNSSLLKRARRPVVVRRDVLHFSDGIRVYNLTVAVDGVYYVNGVLVSNSDAIMMRMYYALNSYTFDFGGLEL